MRARSLLVCLLQVAFPLLLLAQPLQGTDKKLLKSLQSLVTGFQGKGQLGIYIENLQTGKTVIYQADTIFPTASMIKVPILLTLMDKIGKGELLYHEKREYRDSLLYEGEDILGSFKQGEKIELSKLIMLMCTMSDNTASLWLQSLAGGGIRINQLLDSLGYRSTRMNSRTPGREPNRREYGWGQSSPREMADLFKRIYRRQFLNDTLCDRMQRSLSRNYWDEEALSQVPPTVQVFSKNGAVDESRSETFLVMAPHGAYVCSVMTKNLSDTTWQSHNAAWVLARTLSHLLWERYEPAYGWKPVMALTGNPVTDRHD